MAVRQTVQPQRLQNGVAPLRVGCAEQHLLPHAVAEQLIVHILHDKEAAPESLPCVGGSAVPADFAADRLQQAAERAGHRRFADAVAPHQADDLTGGKAHIGQGAQRVLFVAAQRDALQREHRRTGASGTLLCADSGAAVVQRAGAQTVPGQCVRRQRGKLRSGPLRGQAARRKEEIPVRQIGDPGKAMLRQHNGHALPLHHGDHIVQLRDGGGVQVARRLVQHQQPRAEHTGRRERDALLFPARQLENAAVHQRAELELFDDLVHAAADGLRLHAGVLTGKGQLRRRVHVEILGLGVLEHAADLRHIGFDGGLACGQPRRRAAACQGAGIKFRGKAVQQMGERRLAAAAPATEDDAFPGLHRQRDVLQGGGGGTLIGKACVFGFDHSSVTTFQSRGSVQSAG